MNLSIQNILNILIETNYVPRLKIRNCLRVFSVAGHIFWNSLQEYQHELCF